jgi:hypothetical protein
MKTCSKCNLPKEDTDFNWKSKSKGIRHSACNECQGKAGKAHYKNNSEDYKRRAREYRVKLQERFAEWLSDKSCVDCGESDPVVLDCDHVSGTKKFGISDMIKDSRSWESILEELSKCEVRCSNCHRKRTAKQFGWFRISNS